MHNKLFNLLRHSQLRLRIKLLFQRLVQRYFFWLMEPMCRWFLMKTSAQRLLQKGTK